jgi:hypothetical protein
MFSEEICDISIRPVAQPSCHVLQNRSAEHRQTDAKSCRIRQVPWRLR